MTAYSGVDNRKGGAYWELSGPLPITRTSTCRACKSSIMKGEDIMVRDGRKLRFFYHVKCFTGTEDPRTQENSSFVERTDYHEKNAPNISSLEGPRAVKDPDGREMGRMVFKKESPSVLGKGKWSVASRGYNSIPTSTSSRLNYSSSTSSSSLVSKFKK